jgi:DNA-directed RNA polymerase subunit RPC12/RpoP
MVFKGCQRCGGDLYNEEELGQTDLVCLQCGARRMLAVDFIDEARAERANARWMRAARPVKAVA